MGALDVTSVGELERALDPGEVAEDELEPPSIAHTGARLDCLVQGQHGCHSLPKCVREQANQLFGGQPLADINEGIDGADAGKQTGPSGESAKTVPAHANAGQRRRLSCWRHPHLYLTHCPLKTV